MVCNIAQFREKGDTTQNVHLLIKSISQFAPLKDSTSPSFICYRLSLTREGMIFCNKV